MDGGLGGAPARQLPDGTMFLDFDWKAVPPLIELRRLVLPARQAAAENRALRSSRLLKKSVEWDRQIDPGVLPCSQYC